MVTCAHCHLLSLLVIQVRHRSVKIKPPEFKVSTQIETHTKGNSSAGLCIRSTLSFGLGNVFVIIKETKCMWLHCSLLRQEAGFGHFPRVYNEHTFIFSVHSERAVYKTLEILFGTFPRQEWLPVKFRITFKVRLTLWTLSAVPKLLCFPEHRARCGCPQKLVTDFALCMRLSYNDIAPRTPGFNCINKCHIY